MQVIDPKRILKLMAIQDVSQRSLAHHAGYKSHAYMGRILRGEVKNLDVEAAVRIARFFGVGLDDLFVARVSSNIRHNAKAGAA